MLKNLSYKVRHDQARERDGRDMGEFESVCV